MRADVSTGHVRGLFISSFSWTFSRRKVRTSAKRKTVSGNCMIRQIIIIILLLLTCKFSFCIPADSTKKRTPKNNPDRLKLRIGANYNFQTNYAKVEIGIYKNDFPFLLHRTGEWGEIVNHNTFLTAEINVYDRFFIGPKLGYEFNYVFFQGRLNLIDYLDFQNDNTFVFRPEFGGTLFGLFSVTYGYNFIIYNSDKNLTQPHIISLTYNFH